MSQQSIGSQLFDADLRIGNIVWLAGLPRADCLSHAAEDLMSNLSNAKYSEMRRLFGMPKEVFDEINDEPDEEEFVYKMYEYLISDLRKEGFLVEVHCPVPQIFHEYGYTSYGFGHYTTECFYTEALDQAFIDTVLAWKDRYIASERRKWAAKNKDSKKSDDAITT